MLETEVLISLALVADSQAEVEPAVKAQRVLKKRTHSILRAGPTRIAEALKVRHRQAETEGLQTIDGVAQTSRQVGAPRIDKLRTQSLGKTKISRDAVQDEPDRNELAIIYEMVTGRLPFEGERQEAVLYAISSEEPEPTTALRAGLPLELDRILGKALAKRPEDRYQHVDDLGVDLKALLAEAAAESSGAGAPPRRRKSAVLKTSVGQTTPGPASAPRPASKQRRATTVSLAVFGLLILLAVVFVAGMRFGGGTPEIPTYKRLTFRRGAVTSARFAPDGNTIVYSAAWDGGRRELYTTRPESSESRPLNIPDADILAISKTGEMALALRPPHYLMPSFGAPEERYLFTLLQAPLAGGAPREVLEDVLFADWAPDGQLGLVRMMEDQTRVELPVGKVLHETPDRIANFRISPGDGWIAFSERPWGFAGAWRTTTISRNGEKSVLSTQGTGDSVGLVWSPDSEEIWYETGFLGGKTIRALTPSGAGRIVQRFPADLRLLDASRDGRVLVSRVNWRVAANCLTPGHTAERDLSWFDASETDDISPDGETLLMTEFGEGGGLDRWGVYLRKSSGEAAVRLGDGQAFALSPDGSMALTMLLGSPPEIVLLPIGAGEPVRIENDSIRNYESMDWMPDGRHIVFAGSASGQGGRSYVQDIEGGEPRPVTPEGYTFGLGHGAVSPTGEWIAAEARGGPLLFPIAGGEPREIAGVEPNDKFVGWSVDGLSIFVGVDDVPRAVYKINLSTGQRTLWKVLAPADPVGVMNIYAIQISADEKSYCYSYGRNISDLYLVEGLR